MADVLMSVRGLSIAFGDACVTDDVSFDIRPGEILSLVGESGCGKSVTALSILRLLPRRGRIARGEIVFDGRDLTKLTEAELDGLRGVDISMVFQDIMTSLNPVMTIGRQMAEGLITHRGASKAEAWDRAVKILDKVGVREPAQVVRKYPHMLSGGMRQRVMIGMALMCSPRLLIADEPSTALDVTVQLEIMRLLKRLRDELGMAVLLITHDIAVVAEMADRVAVMYAGQVIEQADTRTLLTQPRHAYTRCLIDAVPGLHDDPARRLMSIPGSVPESYGDMTGCRFRARCPWKGRCTCFEDAAMRDVGAGHLSRCTADVTGEVLEPCP